MTRLTAPGRQMARPAEQRRHAHAAFARRSRRRRAAGAFDCTSSPRPGSMNAPLSEMNSDQRAARAGLSSSTASSTRPTASSSAVSTARNRFRWSGSSGGQPYRARCRRGHLPLDLLARLDVVLADVVRGVEGQIDKPRLACVPPDEVAGRVGEQVGAVLAAQVHQLGAAAHVVLAVVEVLEVMDVARAVAEELVEAALGRPLAGIEADVPLAERAAGIAERLQVLRAGSSP